MASDNSALWPVGGFYFTVNIPDINDDLECTEVTGLKLKSKNMDYRPGNDPTFIMMKIPGLKEFENLTIKKAVFKQDIALYTWYKSIQSGGNDQERKDIVITLKDEQGDPIMSWTVLKAFPISYSGPDLKSTDSQIAFESIELTHQGIEQELA